MNGERERERNVPCPLGIRPAYCSLMLLKCNQVPDWFLWKEKKKPSSRQWETGVGGWGKEERQKKGDGLGDIIENI